MEDSTINPSLPPKSTQARGGLFPATQWSAISQARGQGDEKMKEGLRRLAIQYWRPLYLYLRKRGDGDADAADSVQGFFEFILSSGFMEHVDREGGKFRSYLLSSLERWRSRRRVHDGAQKRGGNVTHVPLDELESMRETLDQQDANLSPEAAYDRQWAMEMVARAVDGLKEGYVQRGREQWFELLASALPGGGVLRPYAELAGELGCTEGAVKKAVHDLRTAFAARLREEIRATVRTNEDAEEELRHLIAVMSGL